MARRSYGTGRLYSRADANGRESWYGRWRVGERRINRRLGPKRASGSRDGLTRAQAERALQRRIDADRQVPLERAATVGETGERLLAHLGSLGRKRSTLGSYESYLRVHLAPYFGDTPLTNIGTQGVEQFIGSKTAEGQSAKSVLNYLGFLHSIFVFARKRGMAVENPVALIDKPRRPDGDADIRFLDEAELGALLEAVPLDSRGSTEKALYVVAAMTGLRQGELLGLRWRDVDWKAGRVRVRQSYVRGHFDTPKSRRSSRSVPLAEQAADALRQQFERSVYRGSDDLVFCHPESGQPLDRSRLLKRFKVAARRAGVREVRFHDLRHTFGTRMAAEGVSMRTLQEWMGHRDSKTTEIYADYQPNEHESELVQRAFRQMSDDRERR